MSFVAAGEDIRPSWPLQQLAELVPAGQFHVVPGVAHDFWACAPDVWQQTCTQLCDEIASRVVA
jgi:proline iminopeptidase